MPSHAYSIDINVFCTHPLQSMPFRSRLAAFFSLHRFSPRGQKIVKIPMTFGVVYIIHQFAAITGVTVRLSNVLVSISIYFTKALAVDVTTSSRWGGGG